MSGAYRDRLLRPGDVRRILRRAAELQDQQKSDGTAGRPQTLDELTRIAQDAGISEGALQRALAEGDAPPTAAPTGWSWTGAPGRIVLERAIPTPITVQSHGKLVRVMRRATGELGTPGSFGDSLSWATTLRPTGGGRELTAIVEPVADGTMIRVEENLANLRGGLFGGIVGGVGGGGLGLVIPALVAIFGPHVVPIVFVVWPALVYLLVRRLYAARFAARLAKLRTMADTLVAELGAGEHAASGETVRVAPAPRPDEEEDDAAENANRRASLVR